MNAREKHETSEASFKKMVIGGGQILQATSDSYELKIPGRLSGYANAQIDDYEGLSRKKFTWRAPVSLSLEARASTGTPFGTLGFGFWNDPFSFSMGLGGAGRRLPQMPKAIWFFYGSSPNDFSFDRGVQGNGWKAAVLNGAEMHPLFLAPLAALGGFAARVGPLRETAVNRIKNRVAADERVLETPLAEWHQYQIIWRDDGVSFEVDGEVVLFSELRLHSPLGFLAWIDNQYAMLNVKEGIRFGTLPIRKAQSLHLRNIMLSPMN